MDIASIFTYCPGCGRDNLSYADNRYISCGNCGYLYFHNVAAAAGVIIHNKDSIIVIKRKQDPAKGKLGLPGGFIDPGESAEVAAARECREETGITILPEHLKYLSSYPNVYAYKGIEYNTCDFFFSCYLPDLPSVFSHENTEVEEITAIPLSSVNVPDFAFPSAQTAVELWLKGLD